MEIASTGHLFTHFLHVIHSFFNIQGIRHLLFNVAYEAYLHDHIPLYFVSYFPSMQFVLNKCKSFEYILYIGRQIYH